jgi:hypothetical protein
MMVDKRVVTNPLRKVSDFLKPTILTTTIVLQVMDGATAQNYLIKFNKLVEVFKNSNEDYTPCRVAEPNGQIDVQDKTRRLINIGKVIEKQIFIDKIQFMQLFADKKTVRQTRCYILQHNEASEKVPSVLKIKPNPNNAKANLIKGAVIWDLQIFPSNFVPSPAELELEGSEPGSESETETETESGSETYSSESGTDSSESTRSSESEESPIAAQAATASTVFAITGFRPGENVSFLLYSYLQPSQPSQTIHGTIRENLNLNEQYHIFDGSPDQTTTFSTYRGPDSDRLMSTFNIVNCNGYDKPVMIATRELTRIDSSEESEAEESSRSPVEEFEIDEVVTYKNGNGNMNFVTVLPVPRSTAGINIDKKIKLKDMNGKLAGTVVPGSDLYRFSYYYPDQFGKLIYRNLQGDILSFNETNETDNLRVYYEDKRLYFIRGTDNQRYLVPDYRLYKISSENSEVLSEESEESAESAAESSRSPVEEFEKDEVVEYKYGPNAFNFFTVTSIPRGAAGINIDKKIKLKDMDGNLAGTVVSGSDLYRISYRYSYYEPSSFGRLTFKNPQGEILSFVEANIVENVRVYYEDRRLYFIQGTDNKRYLVPDYRLYKISLENSEVLSENSAANSAADSAADLEAMAGGVKLRKHNTTLRRKQMLHELHHNHTLRKHKHQLHNDYKKKSRHIYKKIKRAVTKRSNS